MSVKFSIEIQGKAEFDRAFNRVSSEIEDFTAAWQEIRAWLKRRLKHQFDTEGANNKWQALSPKYAAAKEIEYPGAKILQRTGLLKESLTDGNSNTIDRITKSSLDYGTDLPYAKYHQDGAEDGAGNLPQRKIYDFDEQDKTDLTKTVQRELVKIVRAQGFESFEF